MKVNKKLLGLLMSAVVMFSFTACNNNGEKADEKHAVAQEESTTQKITDMAGREVEINKDVKKVFSSSPIGTMIMYTFDDEKIAGLNYELGDEEEKFTTEYYQSLPNLGGWFGKDKTGNAEELMKIKPDFVIANGIDQMSKDNADKLQKQLSIPVVLIDDDFDKMGEVYRFLGNVLSDVKRGNELAEYTEATIKQAKDITAKIPEDKKVTVYYAEEKLGLNTDPKGSPHSRLIDLTGGINVANVKTSSGYGREAVSIEQVMAWNPDFIISCIDNGYDDSGSYEKILNDSKWSSIKAVKDKNVYQTPTAPFNWFDRPPSVNTLIGIKWTQNLLYPEYASYDIKKETKEFYKLFYHYDLTDEDVNYILEKSLRTK